MYARALERAARSRVQAWLKSHMQENPPRALDQVH